MKRNLFILSALAAVGSANAVELIVNGGFEDGDPLNGWLSTSDHDASQNAGTVGVSHGGLNTAFLGAWGPTDAELATLSQTVNLAGMASATLSLWICGGSAANAVPVWWVKVNGVTQETAAVSTLPLQPAYTQKSYNMGAFLGGNATVEIGFSKPAQVADNFILVDDVSVQAEPVPEPATILAMAGGVALLALRRRK